MITSENNKALNQDEHNEDAHAKRVLLRGQNPDDGEFLFLLFSGVFYIKSLG